MGLELVERRVKDKVSRLGIDGLQWKRASY
jgi:hypothetical protein